MPQLDIPLVQGLGQQIDKKLMPQGVLSRAENIRVRKDGRIGKRYGTAALPTVTQSFCVFDGLTNGLYELDGQKLVSGGAIVSTTIEEGAAVVRRCVGELSPFTPQKSVGVSSAMNSSASHPVCAYKSGYILYGYVRAGNVYVVLEEEDTGSVMLRQQVTSLGTAADLRAVTVTDSGDYFVLVWRAGTELRLSAFALGVSASFATGGSQIVTGIVAAGGFDAAQDLTDPTKFLLVYQTSTTNIRTARCSRLAAIGTTADAAVTTDTYYAAVHHCTERIYVAYTRFGTGEVSCLSYTTALGGVVAAVVAGTGQVNARPAIARYDATNAMLVWTGAAASSYNALRARTVSNSGALGTNITVDNTRLHSKPFTAVSSHPDNGSVTRVFAIACTSTAGGQFPSYVVLDLYAVGGEMFPQLVLANGRAHTGSSNQLGSVVETSNGFAWAGVTLPVGVHFAGTVSAVEGFRFAALTNDSAARRPARLGPALYFPGGTPCMFDGNQVSEVGFVQFPLLALAEAAGGSLTATGSYSYVAVFEWIDAFGQRHRSEPSAATSITLTGTNRTVSVTSAGSALRKRDNYNRYGLLLATGAAPVMHIYRTLNNGSIYYRITPDTGAPLASSSGVVYSDTASDASISGNEILYTLGGVLPNVVPPACRFVASNGSRLALGGLFDPEAVQFSKLYVSGEPAQFPDDEAFRVRIDAPLTALAAMDGAWVLFTADSIFAVSGDGPDDIGSNAYGTPQRVPSDVGCIDHRSILETSEGVFFQGRRGIYLLPRGFGSPVFIGQPVTDELGAYPVITSALLVQSDDETLAMFTACNAAYSTSRTLVYDLRAKLWTVDTHADVRVASSAWGDRPVFASANLSDAIPVRRETEGTYSDAGSPATHVSQVLELGELRPFSLQGRGLVRALQLLGESRANCQVRIRLSYDSGVTWSQSKAWSITSAAGTRVTRELGLARIQVDELRIELAELETAGGGADSEGFVWHGVSLSVEPRKGTRRFASAERG